MLTAYEFDKPPQTQDYKQTCKFLLPSFEHYFQDKRCNDDEGVE
jgi:hypothetical protein